MQQQSISREPPLVRVALIDHETLFREGLRAIIGAEPDLEIVAQASTLESFFALGSEPEVIVADLAFPGLEGHHVVQRLREQCPAAAVVALTALDDLTTIREALAAGAVGYVLKTAGVTDLLAGIRAVARGGLYLQSSIGIAFASRPEESERPVIGGLTPKETTVLRFLTLGHTNTEIAQLVGASLRTVETHRAHIHQKLDLHTRAQLVRYALDAGLLRLDEAGAHVTDGVTRDAVTNLVGDSSTSGIPNASVVAPVDR